ncbi:MAG TPA: hypothetical protein VGG04_08835 [Candidatus Sulfotelmatobacter sp.]|jgi:hypothetical protein
MKAQRFWIEIVLVGTGIAVAVALLIASLGMAANAVDGRNSPEQAIPAATDQPQETYEGMVTCSRCGAKHPASLNASATTCVRTCIHSGERFALVSSDSTYFLDGDAINLKTLAGQRVRIVGTLRGKTIQVASAAAGT